MSPAASRARLRRAQIKEERRRVLDTRKGSNDGDGREEPAPAAVEREWAPFVGQEGAAADWRGVGGAGEAAHLPPVSPAPANAKPPKEKTSHRRRHSGRAPPPTPPVPFVTVERGASFGDSVLTAPRPSPPHLPSRFDELDEEARGGPKAAQRTRPSCLREAPRWSPRFSPGVPECGGVFGCGGDAGLDEKGRQRAVDERTCCERLADCLISDCAWVCNFLSNVAGSWTVASWKGDMTTLEDLLFAVDTGAKIDGESPVAERPRAAVHVGAMGNLYHIPEEAAALEEIEVVPLMEAKFRTSLLDFPDEEADLACDAIEAISVCSESLPPAPTPTLVQKLSKGGDLDTADIEAVPVLAQPLALPRPRSCLRETPRWSSVQTPAAVPLRKCRSTPLAELRRDMQNDGFREVTMMM